MTNLERFLEKSRQVREAATPGPWCFGIGCDPDGDYAIVGPFIPNNIEAQNVAAVAHLKPSDESNGVFISHARNTSETKDEMLRVMANALGEAIRFMSDGDNGPPRFYIDTVERMQDALARVEELAGKAE